MNAMLTDQLSNRWQTIINIIAEHYQVPVCLIMKVEEGQISVAVASEGQDNPFKADSGSEPIEGSGLFCERAIRLQTQINVPNAITAPDWDTSSVMEVGMVSYLGVPLNWPDKTPFGTLCVLDKTERNFPSDFCSLLGQLGYIFELELGLVAEISRRTEAEKALKQAQQELLEKEKLVQLSNVSQGISHQLGSPVGVSVLASSHIEELCRQQTEALSVGNSALALELQGEILQCNQLIGSELENVSQLLSTLKKAAQDEGSAGDYEVDLNRVIDDAWAIARVSNRFEYALAVSIDEACCIHSREEVLLDVLQEVFTNAMTHGLSKTKTPKISVVASCENGRATITVIDNGEGMSDQELKQAEQPFFSKNKASGNIGLGLNRVKKLMISNMNGNLKIHSDEHGTQVQLMFPPVSVAVAAG